MSSNEAATENKPAEVNAPASGLGNLAEDMKSRPKYYAIISVVLAAVIVGGLLFYNQNRAGKVEAANALIERLQTAMNEGDEDQRMRALADLQGEFKDHEAEPAYLLTYLQAIRQAADADESPSGKLEKYRKAVSVSEQFNSKFRNTVIGTLPWELKAGEGDSNTIAERVKGYCQSQIDWLTKHEMPTIGEADTHLTLTLEDAEGKEHSLKIDLFSSHAPQAVATLKRLAEAKYYDGTQVNALEVMPGEEPTPTAIHIGSAMAKVAPDAKDSWYGTEDGVGFTLPPELNTLKFKKGSVALEWLQSYFGSSPVQLVIFATDETAAGTRKLIGEVSEDSLEVLDTLAASEFEEDGLKNKPNYRPLKKAWKIKSVSFEGTAKKAPASPITDAIRMPEAPNAEEPKEK